MNCIIFLVHNSAISTRFSIIRGLVILSESFSTISRVSRCTNKLEEKSKGLQKALKVLDLINPKTTTKTVVSQNHLRLIQSCKQDLEESSPIQCLRQRNNRVSSSLKRDELARDVFDEILDWDYLCFAMHKKGIQVDASSLSCTLSSCASARALEPGMQLHCLALKTGRYVYVYVGSSLVSLYAKCGRLEDAYKVFDEMPVRNVVSWTALIAGFAQNWQLEICINIYHQMRCSKSKPNDITFIILLSACTEGGALGHGRSAHCQIIQMGFDSYSHVSNALISMYSKCGNVEDSFYIFEKLEIRDIISWNSMIAAYADHGLAAEAMNLFKEMEKQKVQPDAITFLGVLSSCRHSGLVEEARVCFKSMLKYGIEPDLDHYSCMVDLLGRVGLLDEAWKFIENMPVQANAITWGSLLSCCRVQENVWIGIEAAEKRLLLDPGCAATHVQLANLYASVWCWDDAARVRKLMKARGLKTNPGYSWIEIRSEIYRFRVEDNSNPRMDEIFDVVDSLVDSMRHIGYVPRINVEV